MDKRFKDVRFLKLINIQRILTREGRKNGEEDYAHLWMENDRKGKMRIREEAGEKI